MTSVNNISGHGVARDYHQETYSRLQLRLDLDPTDDHQQDSNERDAAAEEADYFYSRRILAGTGTNDSVDDNDYNHYYCEGRRSGKNMITFVIACFDLGCSTLSILLDGRTLIYIFVKEGGQLLISTAVCILFLAFVWFLAAWKLLESSYRNKPIAERYQSAKFWQCMNIALVICFVILSGLGSLCVYGSIHTTGIGINQEYRNLLDTTMFQVCFPIAVILTCVERVASIWIVNKYINTLKGDISVNSLPLRVL